VIQPTSDDAAIPFKQYSFVEIAQIPSCNKGDYIDVIGVLNSVGNLNPGQSLPKLTATLADSTNHSVAVTVFGEQAHERREMLNPLVGRVVAVKSVRVWAREPKQTDDASSPPDTSARSLTVNAVSVFDVDPKVPETQTLYDWWNRGGSSALLKSVSGNYGSRTASYGGKNDTVSMLAAENPAETRYFNLQTPVLIVRNEGYYYTACTKCNKKVFPWSDGQYRCDNCDEVTDSCNYRYILSVLVGDHTGSHWVTAFDEAGTGLMDCSAMELAQSADPEFVQHKFEEANFRRFDFKIRAAQVQYGNQPKRTRCNILSTPRRKFRPRIRQAHRNPSCVRNVKML